MQRRVPAVGAEVAEVDEDEVEEDVGEDVGIAPELRRAAQRSKGAPTR